ncbi:MAG: PqqD family peptide modification chaperone [Promethearchaeota archaeon]
MKITPDQGSDLFSTINNRSELLSYKPWLLPDVLFWKDKEDYLISNPEDNNPMKLNFSTFFILKFFNGKNRLLKILDIITKKFQVKREVAEKDLLKIIKYLVNKNYISLKKPKEIQIRQKRVSYDLEFVSISLTNRCNLNCFMCYANSGECMEKELKFTDWSNVLNSIAKMGAHYLILTGGEPLIYEDLIPLFKYATNLGFDIELCSNGTLITKEIADFFKKEHIRSVRISLDGADAKTHDKIRGITGSFKKTIRGIKLLTDRDIRTEIQTIGCQYNIDNFAEIVELCINLGIYRIEIAPLEKIGRAEGLSNELFLSAEQMQKLHEFMVEHQVKYKKQIKSLLEKNTRRFINQKTCFAYPRCGIGIFLIHFDPIGSIYPCSLLTSPQFYLGNVITNNIKNIWDKSEILAEFRKKILEDYKDCRGCGLRYLCLGGCRSRAFNLKNDLFGPDPYYCIYYDRYRSID